MRNMKSHNNEFMARRLNWNLLKTFLVLAQSGSITEAAVSLHLKQPTVSYSLKQLEQALGKRLIDRSPGTYKLTNAGKMLYQEVIDIYGTILQFDTLMREVTEDVKGHVNLALASHVVCPLLDRAFTSFHQKHPQATLSIDVSASREAVSAVTSRSASLALCLVHKKNPKLEYKHVYKEYFGLYCGPHHPLFGKKGLKKAVLKGQASVSFVTDQISDALRPVTLMRAQLNLDQRIVARSSHLEEVKRLIIAGLGIGPLPLHVVKRDVEDGLLWRLPPYDDPPAINVYLVWNPKSKMNRAEQELLGEICRLIDLTPEAERTYR